MIFDSNETPLTASAIDNPYLFTGRRYDPESGNYYYRARIYSPELGRFLQTDSLGYVDGLNLYAYVGNNPASWVDPYGEDPVTIALTFLGLAGSAIGIATTEPGQDALEALTEHLIHAVETFPENAANVYGQVKDFLLPPRGMESAEEMRALHEHFRQAAAMAKADGEDASSVTPTDDDKICEVDPGPGKDPKFPKKGPGGDQPLWQIEDELERMRRIPWGTWQDYPKVTINGQEYAKVGDRLYSRHAVDRMQPSGMRYSGRGTDSNGGMPQIRQTGGNYDYGRSVAPQYVEDVIASTSGVEQPNGNFSHTSGSLEVILSCRYDNNPLSGRCYHVQLKKNAVYQN